MTTDTPPLNGLVAATFTPLHDDGSINVAAIPQIVDHLVRYGMAGMYILGSTGEGLSLAHDERRAVCPR